MAADLVPAPHDVLASDSEREAVAAALRDHGVAGRLDAQELEDRLGRAYAARRRADLLPLLADLPSPPAPQRQRTRRTTPAVPVLPLVAVLLVAIWALTGAGYFWPIWPIGAMLLTSVKSRAYGHARRRYWPAG
jgi:hypothetical protein